MNNSLEKKTNGITSRTIQNNIFIQLLRTPQKVPCGGLVSYLSRGPNTRAKFALNTLNTFNTWPKVKYDNRHNTRAPAKYTRPRIYKRLEFPPTYSRIYHRDISPIGDVMHTRKFRFGRILNFALYLRIMMRNCESVSRRRTAAININK